MEKKICVLSREKHCGMRSEDGTCGLEYQTLYAKCDYWKETQKPPIDFSMTTNAPVE